MALDRYAADPAARAVTWVVLDFEGTTPTGHPAEPIELGAVLLRLDEGPGGWDLTETGRFEALIRPPAHAPVTVFDTRQTGITAATVAGCPDAATVLGGFDATLTAPPYVTVAHHAPTEAGILRRYAHACPTLAAAPVLDTVRLARHALPGLPSYRLDALLIHLDVPMPAGRHRALPDVAATAVVLRRLLAEGAGRRRWSTLAQLQTLAGVPPVQYPTGQEALF
jgi:DNA polymerase III epsilon subunit-like protein